ETATVNSNDFELEDNTKMKNGGILNENLIRQLIKDGFVNEDRTLTDRGKRISDLHQFCFPIGTHPFSHTYLEVKDLYSNPQYILIDDVIYYSDGKLVYELGKHLRESIKDISTHNQFLQNSVNKNVSKSLIDYIPYSYCPVLDIGKIGEGFIA